MLISVAVKQEIARFVLAVDSIEVTTVDERRQDVARCCGRVPCRATFSTRTCSATLSGCCGDVLYFTVRSSDARRASISGRLSVDILDGSARKW